MALAFSSSLDIIYYLEIAHEPTQLIEKKLILLRFWFVSEILIRIGWKHCCVCYNAMQFNEYWFHIHYTIVWCFSCRKKEAVCQCEQSARFAATSHRLDTLNAFIQHMSNGVVENFWARDFLFLFLKITNFCHCIKKHQTYIASSFIILSFEWTHYNTFVAVANEWNCFLYITRCMFESSK